MTKQFEALLIEARLPSCGSKNELYLDKQVIKILGENITKLQDKYCYLRHI